MAETICKKIPKHEQYCEVFVGAGWVFFRKEPSKYELINDINGDLVAFYRVLQNHVEEFCKQFKFLLSSREWFEDWKRQQAAGGLTDIQQAARFYYLQRHSFAGRVRGQSFGASLKHTPRINLIRLEEEMSEVHLRLCRVVIEHLPWRDFIRRYDSPETFFYLDPPYYDREDWYGPRLFSKQDFIQLAETLGKAKGSFILSLNDVPEVRKIFKGFTIESVTTRYSCSKSKSLKAKEVLISNY